MTRINIVGLASLAGFIATIFVANWLVQSYGLVDVVPGPATLEAPAAVFSVGLAFTFRDVLHRTMGPGIVIGAVVVGAVLSYFVAPLFAIASGAAFLVSEVADLLVYTPLEHKGWVGAVVASNIVGLVVDSILFLWLSPIPMSFLPGQVIGKAYMTALALMVLVPIRRSVPARA